MANGTKIKCLARTKGFSIVNNVLLRDVRLTPKARHIGIFMLSQSDEPLFRETEQKLRTE